jgi:aryl-alcohol dehydrogenase-like predicted oxidoreductase
MLLLCEREGIGVLPWSPLARGYRTRPHERFVDSIRGELVENSRFTDRIATSRTNGGNEINDRVAELAAVKGVTMAQLALVWLLHQPASTSRLSDRRASSTWKRRLRRSTSLSPTAISPTWKNPTVR